MSDAMVEALRHWPSEGIPERPGAWLFTTARRKGLDKLRRDARYRDKLAVVAALPEAPPREPDDRLRLIFTCCHPALGREAQVALTLRAIAGLTTAEIARAFLLPEPTVAKRITRAKSKIQQSGIPYRVPEPEEMADRLDQVLTVIYLVFNEGYVTTAGPEPLRRDLARDAEWLAGLLARLMPEEPEVMGLLSLIRIHLARWPARVDAEGRLVLLEDQDRSRWDQLEIEAAVGLLERAANYGHSGRYQIEAAIAAVHAEAPSWAETDWEQLVALYGLLAVLDRSPVVLLNRAVAVAQVEGAQVALGQVDSLGSRLDGYYLFHATRAELLRRLGRMKEAGEAAERAGALTTNQAERALIGLRAATARS